MGDIEYDTLRASSFNCLGAIDVLNWLVDLILIFHRFYIA